MMKTRTKSAAVNIIALVLFIGSLVLFICPWINVEVEQSLLGKVNVGEFLGYDTMSPVEVAKDTTKLSIFFDTNELLKKLENIPFFPKAEYEQVVETTFNLSLIMWIATGLLAIGFLVLWIGLLTGKNKLSLFYSVIYGIFFIASLFVEKMVNSKAMEAGLGIKNVLSLSYFPIIGIALTGIALILTLINIRKKRPMNEIGRVFV